MRGNSVDLAVGLTVRLEYQVPQSRVQWTGSALFARHHVKHVFQAVLSGLCCSGEGSVRRAVGLCASTLGGRTDGRFPATPI